jgi:hypothetical protein
MRIFDLYEHPDFEVEQADKAEVRSTIRRLGVGVGATVSAIAAISYWYCWSDPSPPSFLLSITALLIAFRQALTGRFCPQPGRLAFGELIIPFCKGEGYEGNERPGHDLPNVCR